MSLVAAVRELKSLEEFRQVEEIQRRVWGMADVDVVPYHFLRAVADKGGIVLGAFVDNRMVGFVAGVLGWWRDRLIHYSHMLAVLPEYRGRGIGYQLKLAQRAHALEQGVDLIVWTFDPLRVINGWLNVHKLGGIVRHYLVNYYGEMRDALNRGIPSDRFLVEWWIKSQRVKKRIEARAQGRSAEAPVALKVVDVENPQPLLEVLERESCVLVPLPFRTNWPPNVQRWRSATREVFSRAFAQGFIVTDMVRLGRGLCAYLMERKPLEEVLAE